MDRRIYDNYVLQVAKFKSMTKAASAMGISQPALSAGLTALEKELGFQIFYRRKVPITFTPEGEIYHEYLKKASALANDYRKRVEACQKTAESHVSIGGPVAYVESIVTEAARQLLKEGKNYQISIKCAPLHDLIELASEGELDCFISTSADIPDNFAIREIKKERIYLCVPANDPINERLKKARTAQERADLLRDGEFVFLEKGQPIQRLVDLFFEKSGMAPLGRIRVNQISTAVNLAVKGAGMCFASGDALTTGIDLREVCTYDLSDSFFSRAVYIAYDKGTYLTKACKDIMEHILKQQ